jgi:putative protease
MRGHSLSGRSMYVGEVVEIDPVLGRVKIDVKNRFAVGDKLEILESTENQDITLEAMWNTKGEPIEVAPGSGHFVWIELKPKGDKIFIARYI